MNPNDIEFDEFCDPRNPRKIKFEDIRAAATKIAGTVIRTPCTKSHLSDKLGVELYIKQEYLQTTGSFKERGVRYSLMNLSDEQKKIGVITASFGNHGTALSHHATQMGIPCIVVLPSYTPTAKVARCEKFGAKVLQHGTSLADAKRYAMGLSKEKKMMYINGFDYPHVVEGQGTVGLEILEQVPDFDAILIPTGGGSLLAGVCTVIKHLKPQIECYGIETTRTMSMTEALRKNERTFFTIESTIADGLAVNTVGVNTFHSVKGLVDKMVVVPEDWVARAVTRVVEEERIYAEGAGCVGIAAIMAGLLDNLKGKRVVSIMSGGNISPFVMKRVLERGLTAEGRLMKFVVVIDDRTGALNELCALMDRVGVAVRDMVPERCWLYEDVASLEVKVICETKGWDHTKEIIQSIKQHYKKYHFPDMGDSHKTNDRHATRRGPCLAPHPACMQQT